MKQVRQKRRRTLGVAKIIGLIGSVLLIVGGLSIVLNETRLFHPGWQEAVTDARALELDELLPLAEPVEPLEGWHDMSNMPDPTQGGQSLPADQPQPNIDIPVAAYDFGTIPPGPGNVSQLYYIQNSGTQPLIISSVVTSCGCTRALLSSSVIPPGQRADLTTIFDPDYHDTQGPVKRVVWLETNDPDQPLVELSFVANVQK